MYILFFEPLFSFKSLFTTRFWIKAVGKFGITIFSQSKYHHTALYYTPATYSKMMSVDTERGVVSEAHIPVWRHIDPIECFLQQGNTDVWAGKVIKRFNKKKLAEKDKELVGSEYDFEGAVSSEGKGLFKKKRNDKEIFCSEGIIVILEYLGLINRVDNKNDWSPQESYELEVDKKVIEPELVKVWDAKTQRIVNPHIFE